MRVRPVLQAVKDFQLTLYRVVRLFIVVRKDGHTLRLSPLKPHVVCHFLGDTWQVMKDSYDSESVPTALSSAQEVCRGEAGDRWERSGGIEIRGLVCSFV